MSNLVPVVRKDKNGKSTTRWVKESVSAPATETLLPAPTALDNPPVNWDVKKEQELRWRDAMSSVSPRAAELFETTLKNLSSREAEQNSFRYYVELYVQYYDTDTVENFAFFCDVFNFNGHRQPHECFAGLGKHKWFGTVSNYLKNSFPHKKAQARALIYAVTHLDGYVEYGGGSGAGEGAGSGYEWDDDNDNDEDAYSYHGSDPEYYFIYEEDLVKLLLDHPDKAEQIVEMAESDEKYGWDRIGQQIMLPEKALRDGVL